MSDKRPSSTKLRRAVWDHFKRSHPLTGRMVMDCHICGNPIDPVAGDVWDEEHVTRRVLNTPDTDVVGVNVFPAHRSCHKPKTANDEREHHKGLRAEERHYGIKRSRSPMPGSRHHPSGLRKRMSGKVDRW